MNCRLSRRDPPLIDLSRRDPPLADPPLAAPPKVIWLTCGNTLNENLRHILHAALKAAISLLTSGESIVEITGPSTAGRLR
jgi:hypothetical protein